VATAVARLDETKAVTVITPHRIELITRSGRPAVVHAVVPTHRWAALVRTTGSRRHVTELEELAARRGLEFRGFELRDTAASATGSPLDIDDEMDFYAQLGLRFIEPELREGLGEIEEAATSH